MADMTVAEAKRRLKACGWYLYAWGAYTEGPDAGTHTAHAYQLSDMGRQEHGQGNTEAEALADLVARIGAMESKR